MKQDKSISNENKSTSILIYHKCHSLIGCANIYSAAPPSHMWERQFKVIPKENMGHFGRWYMYKYKFLPKYRGGKDCFQV